MGHESTSQAHLHGCVGPTGEQHHNDQLISDTQNPSPLFRANFLVDKNAANHGEHRDWSFSQWCWSGFTHLPLQTNSKDEFGDSVATSANGQVIVVGAPTAAKGAGRAYVFHGTNFKTVTTLTPGTMGSPNGFGSAVALNGDGSVAVVGSPSSDSGTGAAFVFSGSGYGDRASLIPGDLQAKDQFGFSVAVNGAGNIAMVGSFAHNNDDGAAYIFTGGGSSYSQIKEFQPGALVSGDLFGWFGQSVALNATGNVALVGYPGYNQGPSSGVSYGEVERGLDPR